MNGRATGDIKFIQKRPKSTFSVNSNFDSSNVKSKYKTSMSVQKDKVDLSQSYLKRSVSKNSNSDLITADKNI